MKNQSILAAAAILAFLVAIATALPTAAATETKPPRWPKPDQLNTEDKFRDSKEGWGAAVGCVEDPTTPPSPLPLPPGISNLLPPGLLPPGLFPPGLVPPSFPTVRLSATESKSISKCMNNHPKAKDCYAQILSSWANNAFHLDSQCCKLVVTLEDACNDAVFSKFNSAFFPRLLQHTCHLKNKN